MAKLYRENQEPFVEKINKAAIVDIIRVWTAIDINSKYRCVISNVDIDVVRDLERNNIKKYSKCSDQIQAKVDCLHKD